jgi:hypothetical protein
LIGVFDVALPTVAINKTKIKFRFAEPYTSEASNFQAGINDPGVYRGGLVRVDTTGSAPYRAVCITIDGTPDDATVVLHRNADGYGTVVNETGTPSFDLSTELTWPIPSGGIALYVYLDVDYDTNAETSGLWGIAEIGDVPANAVILACVDLPAGVTAVSSSHIRTDGTNRTKTLNKKGILVQKRYEFTTNSSGRFLLPDRVSMLGGTVAGDLYWGTRYIWLTGEFKPMVDSDGDLIIAEKWYTAATGGSEVTDNDLDDDGCYTNPYVQIAYSNGTDVSSITTGYANYYSYVSLDSIVTTGVLPGFTLPHANVILSGDLDGTYNTVSQGFLSTQLLSILNIASGGIPRNETATISGWTLLWRNNNKADGLVDGATVSLYYSTTGIMITRGGYISGSDFIITSHVSSPYAMYAYSIDGTEITNRYVYRSGPATLSLTDPLDWTTVTKEVSTGENIYNLAKSLVFDQYQSITMNGVPNTGSNAKYIEIFSMAESEVRIYFSSKAGHSAFIICSGCYYYGGGSNLWKRVSTSSVNATQLYIGRDGIRILNKDKDDADFATGWEDSTSDWSHVWEFGGSTNPFLSTTGESSETSVVPFQVTLNSGHVLAMAEHTYTGPTLISSMNFRTYRSHAIGSGDFTYNKLGSGATLISLLASEIGYWGAKIQGKINIVDRMTILPVTSRDAGFFVITGTGYNWFQGQIFAVRGTTTTGIYTVSDWSEGGGSTQVDIQSGGSTSDHGGTVSLYTVFPEDENEIIEAFYEVKLF